MTVRDARFIASVFDVDRLPRPGVPEIAFCGRSNVGKSSLINTLLHRRIVKTSATPGRTQSINFVLVNRSFYFVDLPGYGYARVPEHRRRAWRSLIETYLRTRQTLCCAVLIVDARREPGDDETLFVRWLERNGIVWILAVTKIDKLPRSRQQPSVSRWEHALSSRHTVPFSAVTGQGAAVLWKLLHDRLNAKK